MRFLSLGEVLALHRRILAETGGKSGVRDLGGIASALAQPKVSVGGQDAYPTLIEKAAALGTRSFTITVSTTVTSASRMRRWKCSLS